MLRAAVLAGLASLLVLGHALPAHADLTERTGTFAGATVTYQVVLPAGYDPARAYPLVLVFAGGGQSLEGTIRIVQNDWRAEAERRGYIVVSPASPDGSLFYEGADRIFPEFLEQLRRDYRIQGKMHVAGASNGGITALHLAVRFPDYFATVTGYPGMLDRQDVSRTMSLKDMCVFLHVGDRDPYWVALMQAQTQALLQRGIDVRFTIEKNQNHGLRAAEIDLSRRLFEDIEGCHASGS